MYFDLALYENLYRRKNIMLFLKSERDFARKAKVFMMLRDCKA
jgi:hypothetical protein